MITTSIVALIATFVFFAGIAWEHLAKTIPSWVKVVTGLAAAVLAVIAFIALVKL